MNRELVKEQEQLDQFHHLLSEVQNSNKVEIKAKPSSSVEEEQHRELDVLNLPPRKEIHVKNGKIRFKISKPLRRMVLVTLSTTIISLFIVFHLWFL